jgi:hypothetical protein
MKKYLILFAVLFLITSCSTQRFSINSNSSREVPKTNPHFSKWSHFFFWGIGQETILNSGEMCINEGGTAFVETKLTFAQGLIGAVSYGIYSPRTNNIYCNKQ